MSKREKVKVTCLRVPSQKDAWRVTVEIWDLMGYHRQSQDVEKRTNIAPTMQQLIDIIHEGSLQMLRSGLGRLEDSFSEVADT